TEDKLEYAKSLIESNSLKQLNEAIELLDGLQQRLEDEAAKQPEQEVEEPAMPAGEALEDSQGEGHSPSPEIDSTIEGIKENVKEARKERFEKEVLRRKGRNAMLSNMLLLFVVLTVTSGVVYGIHVISISLFGITNIIILLRVFFSSK
ncbi:MAG: hypothetical protein GY868_11340, partial [Deltaproteobacteria bacterium]|nr:hypothetical protein [Deltaproteobacteria bacterium]